MKRLIAFLGPVLLLAFVPPMPGQDQNDAPKLKASGRWPPTGYTRVVAHRFNIPEKGDGYFSLIRDSSVNIAELKKLTVKSVDLTAKQTKSLLAATFSKTQRTTPFACYEPHHIFLFYGKDGGLTNAIEVCFECTSVATLPDLKEPQWYRHDFRTLALLCEELGVWLEKDSAKNYIKLMDEREAE